MAKRHLELSAYFRERSREPASSNQPDLNEEESLVLAITVAFGVSVSLVVGLVTVLVIASKG